MASETRSPLLPPGSLPRPGPLGRWARLLPAAFGLWVTVSVVRSHAGIVSHRMPRTWLFPVLVLGALYLFRTIAAMTLGPRKGNRVTAGAVAALVLLAVADYAAGAGWYGPRLGAGIFVLAVFSFGYLAASSLLQALLATPG